MINSIKEYPISPIKTDLFLPILSDIKGKTKQPNRLLLIIIDYYIPTILPANNKVPIILFRN